MNKKRRGEDSAESNTPAKKLKAPEFNGTAFKAMLKDPGTAMKGRVMLSGHTQSVPRRNMQQNLIKLYRLYIEYVWFCTTVSMDFCRT